MIFQKIISFIPDAIQILILFVVIYSILKAAKGSRFGQVLMGIVLLFSVLIAFSFILHFVVLSKLVNLLLGYLAISAVVLFQPEIRSGLAKIGALLPETKKGTKTAPDIFRRSKLTPASFLKIILQLSRKNVGALIAFERGISLQGYQETGVTIDAVISKELVSTIFHVPTPLHDGGMIIRGNRIAAAHCLFPVSRNPDLDVSGLRHRAAVGLSEETDAVVIVVSEETGIVSVARRGAIRKFSIRQRSAQKQLLEDLEKLIPRENLTPWEILLRRIQRWVFKKMPMDRIELEEDIENENRDDHDETGNRESSGEVKS